MSGYMTKLNGHIYEGGYPALESLENGVFVELNAAGGVQKISGAKDTVMRVVGKTDLWGVPALDLTVVSVGKDEIYFVENEWDINDSAPYDETKYTIAPGDLVRMHRPLLGESLVATVDAALFAAVAIGSRVAPRMGGILGEYTIST